MEKEYLNCEISLTPQCPQKNHKFMQKLLIQPDIEDIDMLDNTHIKGANSLCKNCEFFVSV